MSPPGYMSKQAKTGAMARERRDFEGSYEAANSAGLIVTGSPKTITQKFKHIIDRTDPGTSCSGRAKARSRTRRRCAASSSSARR